MKVRKYLLLYSFIFLNLSWYSLIADCGKIAGHIYDSKTKKPLEFATLFIKELNISIIANAYGHYEINNLCNGTYTFVISHLNCERIDSTIAITTKTKSLDFYLPHSINHLEEIAVTAIALEKKENQLKETLNTRVLEQTKGLSLGESLTGITGVYTIQTGNSISKPVIHGLHSNRILILNNGVRHEGQQWGNEHAPEIDPLSAGKLSIIKGANSVRYGSDAIGGVILVEANPLPSTGKANAEFNLIAASANRMGVVSGMIEQNLKKINALSWRIQGTLKKSGNVKTPHYYLDNTGLSEYNFSYTLTYTKKRYGLDFFYSQFNTTVGIFSGSHIGNLTDLYKAFNNSALLTKSEFSYEINRPYQHIEHELFKLKSYFILPKDKGKINLIYARQYNLRSEYDTHTSLNDSIANLNRPQLLLHITTHTGELTWESKLLNPFISTIGISSMTQENTSEGRYFIPNYSTYSTGVFWIERLKKEKIELELGARYDYKFLKVYKWENNILVTPNYEFRNISGTIGSLYNFSPHLSLAIHTGTAWRSPGVNELYSNGLHHGTASIEIGDKNLTMEKAWNTITSLSYDNHKNTKFEIGAYYNHISNFIYLQPSLSPTLTIQGAFPTFYYKQTTAGIHGLDMKINYSINKKLSAEYKLSLVRGWNYTDNTYLIYMPADRHELHITYESNRSTKIINPYITISSIYTVHQSRVPANSDFISPPEAYILFNIVAGCTIKISHQILKINITGSNLLNTVYRDYLNRFRYYADDVGRNIVFRLAVPIALLKSK